MQRHQTGNVWLCKKTQTWFFRFYENGKRKAIRIGRKSEIPTKAAAKVQALALKEKLVEPQAEI